MITANCFLPFTALGGVPSSVGAHYNKQLTLRTSCLHGIIVFIRSHIRISTRVGDANSLTYSNHIGNLLLIGLPMRQEHTRCARHSQHIGIGSQGIFFYRILSGISTLLGIVILYECYSILAIVGILIVLTY